MTKLWKVARSLATALGLEADLAASPSPEPLAGHATDSTALRDQLKAVLAEALERDI